MHRGHRQPPFPKISFILCEPTSPERKAHIIASLQAHSFRNFECIIVGNCSTSILVEARTNVADVDPRFHFVHLQAPVTIGAARNMGLRLARGPYVALLQSEPPPDDLEWLLRQLDKSRHAGLYTGEPKSIIELQLGQTILRTSVACTIGGFTEAKNPNSEAQFFYRLLVAGYTLVPDHVGKYSVILKKPVPFLAASLRKDLPVLFIPHKDYHVWTIGLLAPQLRALGVDFLTLDLTPQWGEAGVRSTADRHGIELLGLGEFMLGHFVPRVTITFNDWDYISRPLVLAARVAGLMTLGIVEGIQDYNDADTAVVRNAYRLVENVILPGVFDYRYFTETSDQRVFITGIPRIQAMRSQPEPLLSPAMRKRILINSNFSYGVLIQHRDDWLTAAVRTVKAAGYNPVISRHPADKGQLFPELVSTDDFYQTLRTCCGSVQRFASGVLEAIAHGKPVFYFNIHNEKADKFTFDPMGTYPVSHSEDELAADLGKLPFWQERIRENGPAFLDLHAGKRTLDIVGKTCEIIAALSAAPSPVAAGGKFYACLRAVDQLTDAFCAPDEGQNAPFFKLNSAIKRLRALSRERENDTADP